MGPRKMPATCEITSFVADRDYTFRAVSRGLVYDGRLMVAPREGGSSLTMSGEGQLSGFVRRLQPIISGRMRQGVKSEVAAIKAHLERQPQSVET